MSAPVRRAVTSFALLAAGLVGGGVTLGIAPVAILPAAGAATCTSAGGVSVVVDFRELGGSTITACAADGGGRSATAIFDSVGVALTQAQRAPGFVCRVNGVPVSDPCQNASPVDAYWGLWWADGSSASWTYSSSGVGGLIVPAGGSVGWSWKQGTGSATPPGVAPPVAPAATPTPSPTSSPTSSPSSPSTPSPTGGASGGDGGKDGGKGGGKDGAKGGKNGSPSPTPSPSATPSESASPDPSESPLPSESPSDSTSKDGSKAGSKEGSKKGSGDDSSDDESSGDSSASEDADPSASGSESPGDSTATGASEAGSPTADEPARVPAAVTWGVVALLAIAIAASAVVARRRRGA